MLKDRLVMKKEELERMISESENLGNAEIIKKSQEIDRLIVLYTKMEKKISKAV